ncbi:MAG: aminopeptidase P family protein [Mesorhizobium sp.]|uniref:M24 family metallopeptidase n=3 Tax=unclassified Mesorhizobium TaxID=325217 RepID=UPI000FE7788E|nr:Xaa-Pro peptidase family protein [Mesorhizobium sp.]RWC18378.1 MAG: aminopeptidase P family protein [Mesorhizobium sp.]RWC27353.1 MAG: aminopeptidase P family protein [Mesorhizobium sp.]RWC55888.1 MAG: aminopeptidase P family protein [Mesorhizobium sp.]RWD42260.1 MAG: aminopeptidase P family protein [Mesorhizobium sp.]TIL57945.1 MAG: aminopeptidase P family protein [Mesorhizobium sp.]
MSDFKVASPDPDGFLLRDNWSDLRQFRQMPDIDFQRLDKYRKGRLRAAMRASDVAMCVLVSPITIRYAIDYNTFPLFQSHIPVTYLFFPLDGPVTLHQAYSRGSSADRVRSGRPLSFFEGGYELPEAATLFADDTVEFLNEIGTTNRKVALEYINPSITQALLQRGLEVIDAADIVEGARVIKSDDEIACIRWACAVAEHGIARMQETMGPGVTEVQLWGILNYTNLANQGGWHEGRMLASGPRINPWLQEATQRVIEPGDLVGFDTDMVGPFGYFCDVSRTFYYGKDRPSARQRQLYRYAYDELHTNMKLIRAGLSMKDLQAEAWPVPEEFHEQAYTCVIHGVGMCDEYPQVKPIFRGPIAYDATLEAGMVVCVESYIGAVGERDGVKLEEQVLVTRDGFELLSTYPFEERLLG